MDRGRLGEGVEWNRSLISIFNHRVCHWDTHTDLSPLFHTQTHSHAAWLTLSHPLSQLTSQYFNHFKPYFIMFSFVCISHWRLHRLGVKVERGRLFVFVSSVWISGSKGLTYRILSVSVSSDACANSTQNSADRYERFSITVFFFVPVHFTYWVLYFTHTLFKELGFLVIIVIVSPFHMKGREPAWCCPLRWFDIACEKVRQASIRPAVIELMISLLKTTYLCFVKVATDRHICHGSVRLFRFYGM